MNPDARDIMVVFRSEPMTQSLSAAEALERLKSGNARFVAGTATMNPALTNQERIDLIGRQAPVAVVLGCSDARVPVEIVFDQGFGELFVIRVAGNVVASSQIGSVEFAVETFGINLIVVLGHTYCGAIRATLDQLRSSDTNPSRGLRSIVDRVRPAVESLMVTELRNDDEALIEEAVRANVRASTNTLRHSSDLLERMLDAGKLMIVGAEYSLDDGIVDFFDGVRGGPS